MVRAPSLRVPRAEAEAVRQGLLAAGALRGDLKPRREGDAVVFPVAEGTDAPPGAELAEAEFEEAAAAPRSYRDLLDLPAPLAELLPSSFDVIGHVLVLKLPDELLPHRAAIARALLAANAAVRTVALDHGVKGAFRVRDLEVVAGEPGTRTEHVEHGVRLEVDPATAYFSPRLATERRRVAEQVRPGERVVDLFAGVGPFALVLARLAKPARVDAVELNPAAYELLDANVRRNRAATVVFPHLADAREWAPARAGQADRVVMNLPHAARTFLDEAVLLIGAAGGVVHHHVVTAPEDLPAVVEEAARAADRAERRLEVAGTREVRNYSPQERHFAVDLRVLPK